MAKKSWRDHCAPIIAAVIAKYGDDPAELKLQLHHHQNKRGCFDMLVTVNNLPSTDRGYCWAFVDFYDVNGKHVKRELKYGTNKTVSQWLRQTIGGLEIVDKQAVLFLQAKNGTG